MNDASRDNTSEVLALEKQRNRLSLRVATRASSGGAAVGRESGWRAASGPVIAFTDDDCVPDPEWLARGLEAIAREPNTFVQGKTLPRPDELHKWGPYSRTINVTSLDHAFQTTNIFYPRQLLEQVDGFDTDAYEGAVGGEDTDLGLRVLEAGAKSAFEDRAVVYHAVNALGPRGLLRVAGRWTAVLPYAKHRSIRDRDFVLGIFRKRTHALLIGGVAGLLAKPLGPFRVLTLVPYLRALRARMIADHANPMILLFYLLHDVVEIVATIRGGIKSRRFMI